MAGKPNCVSALAETMELSDFDLERLGELENEIHDLMEVHKGDRAALEKEFAQVLEDFKVESKVTAAQSVANIIKERRLKAHIVDPNDFKGSWKRFLDLFEGINSIETLYRTFSNDYSRLMYSKLKENRLLKYLIDPDSGMDKLIYEQNYNMANGLGNVSDSNAVAIWKTLKELNNRIYHDLRLAGLNVKYRRDYLFSRSYDAEKMMNIVEGDRLASKEAWITDMMDNYVDHEKTFSPSSAGKEREILGMMYDDITSAQRVRANELAPPKKNYLKRLKSRKIEFKNGGAEYEFNTKYGNGNTLLESMQYHIDRQAKTVANVSSLGTHSEKTYDNLVQAMTETFQGKVRKGDIERALDKVETAYREVVNPPHAPTTMLEKAVNFSRGLSAFTKLGSSIFSALWDVNSTAAMYYVRTGESQIKGYADAFYQTVKTFASPEDMRELGDLLNVNIWFNDMAVAMGGHKGDYDTGFRFINKIFEYGSKATGVPHQTKISRVVNGILQAKSFQKMIDDPSALNNLQKLALDEYNISTDELKFLSKYAKKEERLGAITPSSIMNIPLENFDKSLGVARKKRRELFTKYSNYIDDAVQRGTPTPTAKVKRQLGKSRRENTLRIFANLVMQFKETAWQIAITNAENFKKVQMANGNAGATRFVTEYMGMALISYVGFEYMKAKLFNKDDPFEKFAAGGDDAKGMFIDFINKSSIAPVITDALTAATSKYPASNLISYAAGPSMVAASELFKIPAAKDEMKASAKWARRNLLPMNWAPIKAAERNLMSYEFLTGDRIRK